MKWLLIVTGLAASRLCSAETLFYAGDLAIGAETHIGPGSVNTIYYEKFQLLDDSRINVLFGNHFVSVQQPVFVEWEIRVGMAEGNAGTLLAANGNTLANAVATGRSHPQAPQFLEYSLRVEGLDILLSTGTYWMAVRPLTNAALSMTLGENGVGPTAGDHQSIGHGLFNNYNYRVLNNDWSYGVEGTVVPEPATMVVLALGAMGIARRRPRRIDFKPH